MRPRGLVELSAENISIGFNADDSTLGCKQPFVVAIRLVVFPCAFKKFNFQRPHKNKIVNQYSRRPQIQESCYLPVMANKMAACIPFIESSADLKLLGDRCLILMKSTRVDCIIVKCFVSSDLCKLLKFSGLISQS
jgi:hypothetical protein